MWARKFVRSVEYDVVPRTTVPIEQFKREAYASFDTKHATESQNVNCTECVVKILKGLQLVVRCPCRIKTYD